MTTVILSSKYQIVIPKEIRESMNLKPGQRLQLVEKDGKIEVRPILTPDKFIGFLKDKKPMMIEKEPDREF